MPNRIIKESICTSENLNNLSPEEEVFFYRLMVNCDDHGRADARPQILRAKCYPLRTDQISLDDIERWLAALAREELIVLYLVNDKPYLQFKTWGKHQQVRATKSKFPGPDSNGAKLISIDINCNQMFPYSYSNTKSESESKAYSESEAESNSESEANSEQDAAAAETDLISDFEKEFGRKLSPTECDQVVKWDEENPPGAVKEALRRAVLQGKLNMRYIDRILHSWKKNSLLTLQDILEYEEKFEQFKNSRASPTSEKERQILRSLYQS